MMMLRFNVLGQCLAAVLAVGQAASLAASSTQQAGAVERKNAVRPVAYWDMTAIVSEKIPDVLGCFPLAITGTPVVAVVEDPICGKAIRVGAENNLSAPNALAMGFGKALMFGGHDYKGLLREVRLYNVRLTGKDVAEICASHPLSDQKSCLPISATTCRRSMIVGR